jgi:Kelch motif
MTADGEIVLETPYAQGDTGGEMSFVVIVRHGSVGAAVWFSASTPNPAGAPIEIPPTEVTADPFQAGMTTKVDAGYQTVITTVYDPRGTPVPADLSVQLRVFFSVGADVSAPGLADVEGEDPTLVLLLSLSNPMIGQGDDAVAISTSRLPGDLVLNTLFLDIHNPQNKPLIEFENKTEPGSPLPTYDEPYTGPRLDRFYVYFPWGDLSGQLTTRVLAADINLSPDPNNITWDAVPQDVDPAGPNWILFPKTAAILRPNDSVRFVLSGIVTFNPESLTNMFFEKRITGYERETDVQPRLRLIDALPRITSFNATPKNDVIAGTMVDFSWTTWNARTVTFDGQVGLPAQQNHFPYKVTKSGSFILTAISPSDKKTIDLVDVKVKPASILSFTADPPEMRIGDPVKLKWQTESAVTLELTPDFGLVCEDASGCATGERTANPTQRTVYTLTATGGGKVAATVVVFPMPKGWLKVTATAPWNTRDRPVFLAFAGMLWFMAGGTSGSSNDIYASFDGAVWGLITTKAPWTLRSYAGGVTFGEGAGKMWLMGGDDDKGKAFNDVWATAKTDGSGWEQVTAAAAWPARSKFGCIVYQGKIFVIGGWNGSNAGYNDIWSSTNGKDWTQVAATAPWGPRWAFGLGEYKGRLWIFGGQYGPNAYDVLNEVWSSVDGATWQKQPNPSWNPRSYANTQTFGEDLYLFGGARNEASAFDDLWRMTIVIKDGQEVIQWAMSPTPAQGNSAAMGCVKFAGGAWLAGGWSAPSVVRGPNKSVWLYAPTKK